MKKLISCVLLMLSTLSFAQDSKDDRVFVGETRGGELVYFLSKTVKISETPRGTPYITGDIDAVHSVTGQSSIWGINVPLIVCAKGAGISVLVNKTKISNGISPDEATMEFSWEPSRHRTADDLIGILCYVAKEMVTKSQKEEDPKNLNQTTPEILKRKIPKQQQNNYI